MPKPEPAPDDRSFAAPYYGASTGAKRAAPRRLSSGRRADYRSPRGVGDWLIATQAASVGIALLTNLLYHRIAASVDSTVATGHAALAGSAFRALLHQSALASRSLYLLTLLAAVLLLCWFYRIVANLPRLNAQDSRFSPGWAVAFFFIPLANLIYPYNILKEVWQGSDPENALEDGYSWRRNRVTALIGVWWTAHLLSTFLEIISTGALAGLAHRDLSEGGTVFRWLSLVRYAHVIDHLLLIALVARLNKRQDARRGRLQEIVAHRTDAPPRAVSVPSPVLPTAFAVIVFLGLALLIGLPRP